MVIRSSRVGLCAKYVAYLTGAERCARRAEAAARSRQSDCYGKRPEGSLQCFSWHRQHGSAR